MSSLSGALGPPLTTGRRRSLPEAAATVVGAVSLLGLVSLSLLVVLIASERPSFLTPTSRPGLFPAWMVGPLRGLWPGLTRNPTRLEWLVSGLLGAMYVLYLAALATAPRVRAGWMLAAVLAIHVIFLLAPPLSYTDVFNYVNYGRMAAAHHLNPYVALPASEPHSDPSYALSNWHHLRSPYGPLFTLLTYALVPLGVKGSFWALKLIVAAASLGLLALVWKCARLLGRSEVAAVTLVAFNPIVLVWGLGADHNDALMVLFVVLAVYVALRGAWGRAGGALLAAVFIKASAAVLLLVLFAAGSARRVLAGALVAAAGLALASIGAFGLHLPDLVTQSRLVTAIGIPNLVGLALGQGGETAGLALAFGLLVALTVVSCSIWVRRGGDWITGCGVTMFVVVVSLSWAAPWYVLWILPFAALSAGWRLRAAVLVLGAYFILAFMPAAATLARDAGFRPAETALGVRHSHAIAAAFR